MSVRACPECAVAGPSARASWRATSTAPSTARSASRARDLLALGDEELARGRRRRTTGRRAAPRAPRRGARSRSSSGRLEARGCWSACVTTTGCPARSSDLGAAAPRGALRHAATASLLAGIEPSGAVTIVGSRRAGAYGREVAAAAGAPARRQRPRRAQRARPRRRLRGARGRARRRGGPTVAVLGERSRARRTRAPGSGLHQRDPPQRRRRSRSCRRARPTFRWMFPARNRLMAALGGITVVVEAAERSGSLITAEMALDCGRLVGAVPGPVTSWRSSGTNRLLADGAAVIREAQDVLDLLLGPGPRSSASAAGRCATQERAIVDAVEGGRRDRRCDRRRQRASPLSRIAAGARRARARRLPRVATRPGGLLAHRADGAAAGAGRRLALGSPSMSGEVPVALTHRRLGLGRRRGHPGRPEGVRGRRRPRHLRDHRDHGPEHRRRSTRSTRSRPRSSSRRCARSPATSASTRSRSGCSGRARRSHAVAEALDLLGEVPVVVDPVMVSESGAELLEADAARAP